MDLASLIDHTNLSPTAGPEAIDQLIAEARKHRFASVCVNGIYTRAVARALGDGPVKTCCVVAFPLGMTKPTVKAIEATAAAKDGAQEIDFVAYLPNLLAEDLDAAKADFFQITSNARAVRGDIIVKVIIESAALMQDVEPDRAEARIALACQAARETGCDFVKTSTGFHPAGGATVGAVTLMKKHAQGLQVKASGGIRGYEQAMQMIHAGADRLGCSASIKIIQDQPAETTEN